MTTQPTHEKKHLSAKAKKNISSGFPPPTNGDPAAVAARQFITLCENLANQSTMPREETALPDPKKKTAALKALSKAAAAVLDLGGDVMAEFDEALPVAMRIHWKDKKTPVRTYGADVLKAVEDAARSVLNTPTRTGRRPPLERLAYLRDIARYWKLTTGRKPPQTVGGSFDYTARVVFEELFPEIYLPETFRDDLKKLG